LLDLIIGIVTYNNADIIQKTIESVISNTSGITFKIIIHDNNSTDNTLSIIRSLDLAGIEIIDSKTNYGFGYGHNKIIQSYDARYYLILNPDLRICDNILRDFYEYMEQDPAVGQLVPKVVFPTGEIQYLCKQNPTVFDLFIRRFIPAALMPMFRDRSERYEMRETGYNHIFEVPYASGCFMFFRGTVLKTLGGFDENFFMYLEDADITRRTNQISTCRFYPFHQVEHDWAKGSHKSLKLTWVTIQSAFYYFNKWGWKLW
jgi:hypothetical protein